MCFVDYFLALFGVSACRLECWRSDRECWHVFKRVTSNLAGDLEAARKLRFYWSDLDGDWFVFLASVDGKRRSGVENIEVLVLEAQL